MPGRTDETAFVMPGINRVAAGKIALAANGRSADKNGKPSPSTTSP
jgi:hypothetical protein